MLRWWLLSAFGKRHQYPPGQGLCMFDAYADPAKREGTLEKLQLEGQSLWIGAGALHELGTVARELVMHHALLLVDPGLAGRAAETVARSSLEAAGVKVTVAHSVTSTPVEGDVMKSLKKFQGGPCDGVVSLGGGSTIDVGKVVALLASSGGPVHEHAEGHGPPKRYVNVSRIPHVAIATTAGTGAESSSFAFITEARGHDHAVLNSSLLLPQAAILDPLTHVSMPRELTAATGINALASAIEAYLSKAHTPSSDEAALEAMRLIAQNLPRACQEGGDLAARTALARASYLAGRAFSEAGLGIADSISLTLSSLFNVSHSLANAIILPHVMVYDGFVVGERMAHVAKALGRPSRGRGPSQAVRAAVGAVMALKHQVGLTQNLAQLGVSWDDLYLCSQSVLRHPFVERNPRPLDERGLADILLGAIESGDVAVKAVEARA